MIFNSLEFALFLPIVFFLYWFVVPKSYKQQNVLIVSASCLFYGWWDWRFLGLILISVLIDFSIGLMLFKEKEKWKRKVLLWASIIVNLGLLGFFKYYNFFLDSFISAFSFCGVKIGATSLEIILPVGISFYTFQTLSYTIDIYREKLHPARNLISFAAFVSFFPQLVAGPIERASNLLPQFQKERTFDYQKATDGLRQILWGLFKKVVIADNCAEYANLIFNNSADYSGTTLVLGALFFTFQIYGDFSGYSDIAIGTSRLFGFNLRKNFAFPYFSRDVAEYWRCWHISLSSWFKDYLYIPLGGSKGGMALKIRNTFIIFIVSGFWHGANWTYVVWGLLNAIYFLPLLLTNKNRNNIEVIAKGKLFPTLKESGSVLVTFSLTVFAFIIFRAESLTHAMNYMYSLFSGLLTKSGIANGINFIYWEIYWKGGLLIFLFLVLFIIIEWIGRDQEHAIAQLGRRWKRPFRWFFYYGVILCIVLCGGKGQDFIYFQF